MINPPQDTKDEHRLWRRKSSSRTWIRPEFEIGWKYLGDEKTTSISTFGCPVTHISHCPRRESNQPNQFDEPAPSMRQQKVPRRWPMLSRGCNANTQTRPRISSNPRANPETFPCHVSRWANELGRKQWQRTRGIASIRSAHPSSGEWRRRRRYRVLQKRGRRKRKNSYLWQCFVIWTFIASPGVC